LSRRRQVPAELVEQVSQFLSGERTPVEAKGASTVMMLRDGAAPTDGAGLEVYLIRRHSEMPFAAGMYAYPGGRVDPRDADAEVGWAGPTADEWADVLRCDAAEARALVCAAVRETFEESGVLLAGGDLDSIVADTTGDDWESQRRALVDRSLSFTEFLRRRGLVIRTDLLRAWAHWITPEFEPRRYDTRFFVAELPVGQRTRDVSDEADRVTWMRPADAVAAADVGSMEMFPPTYVTLTDLTAFASAAEVLAAAAGRRIRTVLPGVEVVDGVAYFSDLGWEGTV
jgi:8-oxo-dGTP pyrophosphatase MutT (NUDIX family)